MSKAGKEFKKRELVIADDSGFQVRLTLFGNHAETFPCDQLNPIVAVNGGKVGDFGGRTLSVSYGSRMAVEPDIPRAHELKGWWDSDGHSQQFQAYSSESAAGQI